MRAIFAFSLPNSAQFVVVITALGIQSPAAKGWAWRALPGSHGPERHRSSNILTKRQHARSQTFGEIKAIGQRACFVERLCAADDQSDFRTNRFHQPRLGSAGSEMRAACGTLVLSSGITSS